MISAVLFDLDGVLVNAKEWHYMALNEALREIAGTEITRHEHLVDFDGLPTMVKMDALADLGRIYGEDIDAIYALKQERTVGYIERFCYPDDQKLALVGLLQARGIRLACVSNAIRPSVELMLRKSGILEAFECIVSNTDVTYPKPNPEPYLKCLSLMGLGTEEALAVEDNAKGWESSEAAGIRTARLQYPQVNSETLLEYLQ